MQEEAETGAPTRSDARRRTGKKAVAVGVVVVIIVGTIVAYGITQGSAGHAPPSAFRFDEVYAVIGPSDVANSTPALSVEVWFSNTANEPLSGIRMVAVAIEKQRGVVSARAEISLDLLDGRTTSTVEFDLPLNGTRSYQIELLVLIDGFLEAKGYGSFGYGKLHPQSGALVFAMTDKFRFMYGSEGS